MDGDPRNPYNRVLAVGASSSISSIRLNRGTTTTGVQCIEPQEPSADRKPAAGPPRTTLDPCRPGRGRQAPNAQAPRAWKRRMGQRYVGGSPERGRRRERPRPGRGRSGTTPTKLAETNCRSPKLDQARSACDKPVWDPRSIQALMESRPIDLDRPLESGGIHHQISGPVARLRTHVAYCCLLLID